MDPDPQEVATAVIYWPVPWDGSANDYEKAGRYIAQTTLMERFLDLILLDVGVEPTRLRRQTLDWKIKKVGEVIATPDRQLQAWSDLEACMTKVRLNRNAFAHRMMERSPVSIHYGHGLLYVALSDEELEEQAREAFVATELCRQIVECLHPWPTQPRQALRAD